MPSRSRPFGSSLQKACRLRILLLVPIAMALTGCMAVSAASTVTSVAVTAVKVPVKATGKMVDWTTTSQDESDRNLGRKVRKQRQEHPEESER